METGLFSSVIEHVVLILVGVVGFVALVGAAFNYSLHIHNRGKFAKFEDWERDLKVLEREVKDLREQLVRYQLSEAAPVDKGVPESAVNVSASTVGEGPLKQEVWQEFVDDYNKLANSMAVPKAVQACENFVRNNKLHLLICVDKSEPGEGSPVYAPVDEVELSNFWGWQVPGKADVFVVVPNPLVEYDEELHADKGMKETFASNYEKGSFKKIQVKLPAQFSQRLGAWKIVQPGVIRLQ